MVKVGDDTSPDPFTILSKPSGRRAARDGRIGNEQETRVRWWRPDMARRAERSAENDFSSTQLCSGDARAESNDLVEDRTCVFGGEMTRAVDVKTGGSACHDSGKLRRLAFGGESVQPAEQRMGRNNSMQNCSGFWGDIRSGKAARDEFRKFQCWMFGEPGGEGERERGRGEENTVLVLATRSLQVPIWRRGTLASTAASLGDLRCRRSGTGETSDGSVNSLSVDELLRHPLAIVSLVPRELSLFVAGAFAGACAKTVTAPLDRVKLLMQVQGVQAAQAGIKSSIGFIDAIMQIGTEEGVRGYWKGNLPQVIRVIPYSAVQLFAYETYKRILKGDNEELSVGRRLVAGACAGMTSTLVTYPLDTLRLRMAVDPVSRTMGEVVTTMMKQEGVMSFYRGLGPSLLGIAPYIALNFCVFDLVKNSLPEEVRKRPEASLVTALASATFATAMCYPLDTVRRQLQMKGTPFKSVADAFPGIIARDGFLGLYRGFVPNALKNLPSSSIRLTTFDAAKNLISASQAEYDRLLSGRPKTSSSQGGEIEQIPRD